MIYNTIAAKSKHFHLSPCFRIRMLQRSMILKDFCQFPVVAREKDQKHCVELEVFNNVSD